MSSDLNLSGEQEQHIVDAIADAERQTSAEIRVHIETDCPIDPLEQADRVFHELGMDQTERQNGVLIYIASEDHKVAVYGGRGIHQAVDEDFWNDVLDLLLERFRNDQFADGIARAVEKVGAKLSELYPYRKGDVNELANDISYQHNLDSEEE